MQLNFREWLMLESTVTQTLKNATKYPPQVISELMTIADEALSSQPWTRQVNRNLVVLFARWMVYQLINLETTLTKHLMPLPQGEEGFVQNRAHGLTVARTYMSGWVRSNGDYISFLMTAGNGQQAKSKFNSTDYTIRMLHQENEQWHEEMTRQQAGKGDPGRPIQIEGMPAGWTWVSLDKGYCDKEGDAMGHCGNQNAKPDDNIYSLRDKQGYPHLTFIVNKTRLGESKGRGNNKPEKKYHPQIIALLLGKDEGQDIITYIKGGGYKPENNFHFKDLSAEDQQRVLTAKPFINSEFGAVKHRYANDPNAFKEELSRMFNYKFEAVDLAKDTVIVMKIGHMGGLIEWIKENTSSDMKDMPNFDEMNFEDDYAHRMSTRDIASSFDDYADKRNKNMVDEIIELLTKEHKVSNSRSEEDEEEEDYDYQWAFDYDDDLAQEIRDAIAEGNERGAESAAWEYVERWLHNESDHWGFTIANSGGSGPSKGFHPYPKENTHEWLIYITLTDLEKVYNDKDDPEDWQTDYMDLPNQIEFKYRESRDGYSDFDEGAFNERLHEELDKIKEAAEDRLRKAIEGQRSLFGGNEEPDE